MNGLFLELPGTDVVPPVVIGAKILFWLLILALIIFIMVKQINRLRRTEPVVAATPEDTVLLREIRDSLQR